MTTWKPALLSGLAKDEKYESMERLIFLSEKKGDAAKSKVGTSGSAQCIFSSKEEALSLEAVTQSLLTTSTEGAKKERYRASIGMLSSVTQTAVLQSDKRITMKIRGALAGALLEIDPEKH